MVVVVVVEVLFVAVVVVMVVVGVVVAVVVVDDKFVGSQSNSGHGQPSGQFSLHGHLFNSSS